MAGGRPITGWKRGIEIKLPTDVAPGDVLIYDSAQFDATNLIRVKELRRIPPGNPVVAGFYWRYVSPDLKSEESPGSERALAWHWEIAAGGFFKAEREELSLTAAEKRDLERLAEHNKFWSEH